MNDAPIIKPSASGSQNGARKWVPVAALILNACTALLVPMILWGVTELLDLRRWQASVEASRFTARDGQAVYAELAKITTEIAKIPKETPPAWFMEQFRQVQTRLDTVDARLRSIEAKVK